MSSSVLFSRVAAEYSRYRPGHPAELFDYLAGIAPGSKLAWDCGTGNGQAAIALAAHFDLVHASDASADQVSHAPAHERVRYHVEPAEGITLETGSVDLVTAAVAVHWFDHDQFYRQVRRVLRPDGVIAVWTYHLPEIDPAVDQVLRHYYEDVVGRYFPPGFHFVHERYRTLPFPFEEIDPPAFGFEAEWSLEQVAGFLASWSGTVAYLDERGQHPLEMIWDDLASAWGDADGTRTLQWPLHLRIGRRGGTSEPIS